MLSSNAPRPPPPPPPKSNMLGHPSPRCIFKQLRNTVPNFSLQSRSHDRSNCHKHHACLLIWSSRQLICYVSTNYGDRPEADVLGDVDLYEEVRQTKGTTASSSYSGDPTTVLLCAVYDIDDSRLVHHRVESGAPPSSQPWAGKQLFPTLNHVVAEESGVLDFPSEE